MSTERVTLATIAAHAGVSKATVSLVVRESPLVAEDTRRRVLASIADLGYVYNRAAAGLRSRRTSTIGLIVPSISNPFAAELVTGVESTLSELGQTLLFTQHTESLARQRRQIEVMLENRVDGVLLMPALGTPADQFARLHDAGIPLVQVSRRIAGARAPYVGADNRGGARKVGGHLVGHGARSIVLVGGFQGSSPFVEREEGLELAVAMSGAECSISARPCPPTREAGYEMTESLIKAHGSRPAAVFAYNDNVATGVMAALADAGVEIGGEVRVVGFDDVAGARYSIPPLTTVSSRPGLIGAVAAEKLLTYLEDGAADADAIVSNSLAIRASCGCTYSGVAS